MTFLAALRHAAERAADGVCNRIADILDTASPQECANYLTNAAYAST